MNALGTLRRPWTDPASREQQRGQVLALFVIVVFIVIGMVAVVIDVAWFWTNQQHMQRAADAGALAGAVYLPGDTTSAYAAARAEATKNGYTSGVEGVTVTPEQDTANRRRLRVTISGPVDAFFARVFCALSSSCTEQVTASVKAMAEFVLPVPMGSPQNYFGVGHLVDATSSYSSSSNSSVRSASSSHPGTWSGGGSVYTNNNTYATTAAMDATHDWGTFGFDGTVPSSATIDGIEVRLSDLFQTGIGVSSNCQVRVELSWNGGTSWSAAQLTTTINGSTTADYVVGAAAGTTGWGSHSWTRSDVLNGNLRVRLTWLNGITVCPSTRTVSLDHLEIQVYYTVTTETISTAPSDVTAPGGGGVLAPQNFWAAMNSQGAPNIQGDAYLTQYETRGSTQNVDDDTDPDGRYAPTEYYNYGVEIPAGGTGQLWIFDAGFCDAASTGLGTGEFWTVGGANGNSTREPVSAYFDLYDTNETPYDTSDDVLWDTSNDTYEQMNFEDHHLGRAVGRTPTEPDCGDETWHHGWWQLASGLPGGRTYRLHTYSTDPDLASDQINTTAHNAFALWASSSGGTPRVYGIGAMEAYVRLPGGTQSEFYLAQIDAVHAGKTVLIDLWDPGDTGALSASLQILEPTSGSYVPATFDYSAMRESSGGSSCDSRTGTAVSSVTTNSGGTSLYNGCWLTIAMRLSSTYTAPHPSSDSVADEGGWWKIRYSMGGNTNSYSTDLTTWQVSIRGSPVHLVPDP